MRFAAIHALPSARRNFEDDGEIVRFVLWLGDDERVHALLPLDFFAAAEQLDFVDG